MGEKVRIPFKFVVRSVTWRPAGEAGPAEPQGRISLGSNDASFPTEMSLHPDPALDELIEQAKRDYFKNKAAKEKEARKQAREAEAARWEPKTIPPGTSPMVAARYRNLLQPKQPPAASEPAPCADGMLDPRVTRSGAAAEGGSGSPQEAATPTGETEAGMASQVSNRTTSGSEGRTPGVESLSAFAGFDDLPRPVTTSTRGLIQYASNDSIQSDASGGAPSAQSRASSTGQIHQHSTHDKSGRHIPQPDGVEALAKMILTEADSDPAAFAAVGAGALNRLKDPAWHARTLHQILFSPNQFQGMTPGNRLYDQATNYDAGKTKGSLNSEEAAQYEQAKTIARGLLDDTLADPTQGAVYFYSGHQAPAYVTRGIQSGTLSRLPDHGRFHFVGEAE